MRTAMVLSLFFVSLMLVQFYAVVPVANATTDKYVPVIGSVEIDEGTIISNRTSGYINFIYGTQGANFSGTCEGKIMITWHIITNTKTFDFRTIGIGTFTGDVDGKSGTFTFTTVGKGSWITGYFSNEWKIIGGTSGLSNIHGKGTFDGNLYLATGNYLGSVFYKP